jgi:hypothetical protein
MGKDDWREGRQSWGRQNERRFDTLGTFDATWKSTNSISRKAAKTQRKTLFSSLRLSGFARANLVLQEC